MWKWGKQIYLLSECVHRFSFKSIRNKIYKVWLMCITLLCTQVTFSHCEFFIISQDNELRAYPLFYVWTSNGLAVSWRKLIQTNLKFEFTISPKWWLNKQPAPKEYLYWLHFMLSNIFKVSIFKPEHRSHSHLSLTRSHSINAERKILPSFLCWLSIDTVFLFTR